MPYKSVPLFWRLKDSKYRLIGNHCTGCKEKFFPPKDICPNCRRKGKLEKFAFSGEGEVMSYTVIHIAPEGFDHAAPYAVAIVKLAEGPSISAQIVGDPKDVEIGKKVQAVFRKVYADGKRGLIHYGMKFRLA